MKLRIALCCTGLALLLANLVLAADVTGKWIGQVPGRGGQTRETTFTFKVDGAKLTGTISVAQGDVEISDGKVDGDKISFSVVQSAQGNSVTLLFKGTASGDEIKFTRQREGADQVTEFTVKKTQ